MRFPRARSLTKALRDAGDVTPNYVSMIARGVRPITPSFIDRVAVATGLSRQIARACFIWTRGLRADARSKP